MSFIVEISHKHSSAYTLPPGSNDPYRRLCRMTVLSSDPYPRLCSTRGLHDQERRLTWIYLRISSDYRLSTGSDGIGVDASVLLTLLLLRHCIRFVDVRSHQVLDSGQD